MEFLEEETRPRFHLHSRSSPPPTTHHTHRRLFPPPRPCLFLSLSALFLSLSIFFTQSETLNSLLLWLSLSLLLGPFAPDAITAGDIRVGVGKLLADPPTLSDEPVIEKPQFPNRRSKNRRFDALGQNPVPESTLEPEKVSNLGKFDKSGQNPVPESVQEAEKVSNSGRSSKSEGGSIRVSKEEKEWSEGDVEMLKKLVIKHPVGKPKRWEVISEAFGGAHGVKSVIKMAKSMGEKKMSDSDSFSRFLKDRKQLDRRVEAEEAEVSSWSGGDDVALLNAFPKETAMRWEKIAVAVPGKTKAACVKRVAELKRDFRSSKGSNEG